MLLEMITRLNILIDEYLIFRRNPQINAGNRDEYLRAFIKRFDDLLMDFDAIRDNYNASKCCLFLFSCHLSLAELLPKSNNSENIILIIREAFNAALRAYNYLRNNATHEKFALANFILAKTLCVRELPERQIVLESAAESLQLLEQCQRVLIKSTQAPLFQQSEELIVDIYFSYAQHAINDAEKLICYRRAIEKADHILHLNIHEGVLKKLLLGLRALVEICDNEINNDELFDLLFQYVTRSSLNDIMLLIFTDRSDIHVTRIPYLCNNYLDVLVKLGFICYEKSKQNKQYPEDMAAVQFDTVLQYSNNSDSLLCRLANHGLFKVYRIWAQDAIDHRNDLDRAQKLAIILDKISATNPEPRQQAIARKNTCRDRIKKWINSKCGQLLSRSNRLYAYLFVGQLSASSVTRNF